MNTEKNMTRKSSLLAATALAILASGPAMPADLGYAVPSHWAPSFARSGGTKSRSKTSKERARAKLAAKSRRAQRKAGKR